MPNPYTLLPVDEPRYFVAARGGRGAQTQSILEHILRESPRSEPISIIGERRFGKSSLLQYLERATANTPNVLLASIDLLSLSPQTPEGFYASLTESLIWTEALPNNSPVLNYSSFRSFLYEIRKRGQRLILFIDEFDLVARDRRFDLSFFDNLRSLITSFPLVPVVASVAPLADMAHQDVFSSAFWNVFLKERLVPLSLQEVGALISQRDSFEGLSGFTNDIIRLAGRHPFFLQLACSVAWKLRTQANGNLDMAALSSNFSAQARDHYQYIWEHSTDEEQKTLFALTSRVQPEYISPTTLIERGYVDAEKLVQICGENFAEFIQSKCVASSTLQVGNLSTLPVESSNLQVLPQQSRWDSHAPKLHLALVIGVNHYLHQETEDYSLPSLRYAEHDAKEMAALLNNLGFKTTLLLGKEASYEAIQAKFDEWHQTVIEPQHPESRFVFHFSGHGMIDPHNKEMAYLVLYDTNPSNLTIGLEMGHLVYNFLPKVRLRNSLVLLDACHAGFAVGVKHVRPESRRLPNVTQQIFGNTPGRMLLAACPGEAQARELTDFGHGIFTHYLLRHWRDLDEPHPPDRITFGSLVDYVGNMMPNEHPSLPLPVYSGVGVGGTLILGYIPPRAVL